MHLPALTVEYLLTDESFLNYCKGIEADTLYWEKFLNENPQHKETAETARQLYADIFNAFAASDLEEQTEKLSNRISEGPGAAVIQMSSGEKKSRSYSLAVKVAAAVVLIVAGYFTWIFTERRQDPLLLTYSTQPGEKKTIQLSDGSVVMLNASSRISVKETFGKSDRLIKLVGEAFFDVKKNKQIPFIVSTRTLQVKALGTAFNVKDYPGETKCETALVRGLIEVTLHNTRLMLYPNQKVQWNKNDVKKKKTISNDTLSIPSPLNADIIKPLSTTEEGLVKELAWTENKLIFSGETFAEIAPQLERWYGVTIRFEDQVASAYRFTATFEKESLQTVLDVLKESKDFHYEMIQGEKTIVTISH